MEDQGQKYPEPARPATWGELTDSQRLETLRQEVQQLAKVLSQIALVAYRANSMAQQHEHGVNGRPLYPALVFDTPHTGAGQAQGGRLE